MKWNGRLWKNSIPQFARFMAPVAASLGRSERRRAATHYVEGLLMPGQRKSIEPMAAHLGIDAQSLQQLASSSPWSDEALWRALRQEVIPHLEPLEAWVVDESGWLKQGQHSVGISHQYCGAVGKQANCQVSVEVVVSDGGVAAPIAGRLYLPQNWAEDAKRRAEVGVPAGVRFQTKPELGLDLIWQAQADGVPPAPILGDSVYGDSPDFREGVRQLGMEFMLQVAPTHKPGPRPCPPNGSAPGIMRWRPFPRLRPWTRSCSVFLPNNGKTALGRRRTVRRVGPGWGGVKFTCSIACAKVRKNWKRYGWWSTGRVATRDLTIITWRTSIARPVALAA